MKVFLGILAGVLVVAILVVQWGLWVLSGSPAPNIPPARTPAPAGFDAAAYQDMDAVVSTEDADVRVLSSDMGFREYYTIPDLGVTYLILSTAKGKKRYIFLNAQGQEIGEIIDQPQAFSLGRYIVTLDGYYVVSSQSVTERLPYVDVEAPSAADLKAMVEQSTHYRSFSHSDLPGNDLAKGINREMHVMLHDGVWKRFTTPEPQLANWKGTDFPGLIQTYGVYRSGYEPRIEDIERLRFRVELTHFDQNEFLPRRGAAFGSPTGQGRRAQWIGTGYYTVFIDDKPVLRFKLNNDREYIGRKGTDLFPALSPEGTFILIEKSHRNGKSQALIVRDARLNER